MVTTAGHRERANDARRGMAVTGDHHETAIDPKRGGQRIEVRHDRTVIGPAMPHHDRERAVLAAVALAASGRGLVMMASAAGCVAAGLSFQPT